MNRPTLRPWGSGVTPSWLAVTTRAVATEPFEARGVRDTGRYLKRRQRRPRGP